MPVVPQLGVSQSIPVPIANLRTLFSVPFVIAPAFSNYINVFLSASLTFISDPIALAGFNNLIYFQLGSTVPLVLSNQLNATTLFGGTGVSYVFTPINPYTQLTNSGGNLPLQLAMGGADPTGGGPASQLIVNLQYSILQQS